MPQPIVIMALYKFIERPNYIRHKKPIEDFCKAQGLMGTLLLAQEGINGTVAGSQEAIEALLSFLQATMKFGPLEYKLSYDETMPFHRMKVKLKKEIVTIGKPEANPCERTGTYVKPEEWNSLLNDPEVILIDTRNDYEVGIGTFKGALNPKTDSFREFPDYVQHTLNPKQHKKVAMFCTGGIRCEKASSYMLAQGFEQVYQLEGGILKYLETVPAEASLWEGECFVFDNRVTVDHQLQKGHYELCHACREPLSAADKTSPKYELNISCPQCFDTLSDDKRNRVTERAKQMALAKARGQIHLGSH
ncbi:MAG TPA: rhodanese-related sulfurtransferase [Gammaproteobacteria bacterium]|nr:rhodanese-related sulfurtransferase [Gammaproteobacteria bacterium]